MSPDPEAQAERRRRLEQARGRDRPRAGRRRRPRPGPTSGAALPGPRRRPRRPPERARRGDQLTQAGGGPPPARGGRPSAPTRRPPSSRAHAEPEPEATQGAEETVAVTRPLEQTELAAATLDAAQLVSYAEGADPYGETAAATGVIPPPGRPRGPGDGGPPGPGTPGPVHRRLRVGKGARSGGDGGRLRGPANQPQPAGRPEDDPRRRVRRRRPAPAVPERGRGGRLPRPPGHRADLRGRRARRQPLLQHEADRRRGARPPPQGPRRRPEGRRPAHGRRRRRRPPRPPARHPAPRPQAGEHPRRRPGPPARHRFRPGQADRRGVGPDRLRRDPGDPGLHGPRAGPRPDQPDHDGDRRLRTRRRPLRRPDRQGPLLGRLGPGDPGARPPAAPRTAQPGQREAAARPGGHLPQVPRKGPEAALRVGPRPGRRPRTLAPRRTDLRPAGRPGDPRLDVGEAQPGAGRTVGGPVPGARRRPRRRDLRVARGRLPAHNEDPESPATRPSTRRRPPARPRGGAEGRAWRGPRGRGRRQQGEGRRRRQREGGAGGPRRGRPERAARRHAGDPGAQHDPGHGQGGPVQAARTGPVRGQEAPPRHLPGPHRPGRRPDLFQGRRARRATTAADRLDARPRLYRQLRREPSVSPSPSSRKPWRSPRNGSRSRTTATPPARQPRHSRTRSWASRPRELRAT